MLGCTGNGALPAPEKTNGRVNSERNRKFLTSLLALDDCLYALQPTIPHLTRSSLHRCLQRHGISRLPKAEGDKPPRQKFKRYPIGYFHIDIAEVQTAQGRLYLFVAIDRTSKFAYLELHSSAGKKDAAQFLRQLAGALPYAIHTVLTDNGIQFIPTENRTDRLLSLLQNVSPKQ